MDQVNILIKMNVGEPYRLEHIKFRLKQNKAIRNSDTKYLKALINRYIQNVENDNNQDIKTDSPISSEEDSDFIYCWNCGTKNKRILKFCINCAWEIHTVKSTTEDNMIKTNSKTKIRKELVILGLVMIIFGSGAFIVPIGENAWTINDRNVFCKSGMQINEQTISGEQGQENCSLISQLIVVASFLGTLGLILIVIGLVRKKIVIQK